MTEYNVGWNQCKGGATSLGDDKTVGVRIKSTPFGSREM